MLLSFFSREELHGPSLNSSEQKLWAKSGFGVERLQGHFWRGQWKRLSESYGKWGFLQLGCLGDCSRSRCWEPAGGVVGGSGLL